MTVSVTLRRIEGLRQCAGSYRALLCDIWGVLHDGLRAFTPAAAALKAFREQGGRVVLVSNSPRPAPAVGEQLQNLSIGADAWDGIVTSGDLTRRLVEEHGGESFFHLGPQRDRSLLAGLAARPGALEAADFILCSGLFDDENETPDDYAALFEDAVARGLDLICANPDHVVYRGEVRIYCAGALAARYEEMGGCAVYAGKPHLPIYEHARALIDACAGQRVPKSGILAIGDNLKTEIAGGIAAGFDALLIAGGVHGREQGVPAHTDARRLTIDLEASPDTSRVIGFQPALAW